MVNEILMFGAGALGLAVIATLMGSFFTIDQRKGNMLWTIAVIMTVLWILGLASAHTMGGFVHILLVVAAVAVLVRVIQGRKILS